MLAQRLMPATSGGIQYVGGKTSTVPDGTASANISLTGLTGGIASAPSVGDLAIVYFGVGFQGSGSAGSITGYTQVASISADDQYDTSLSVHYRTLVLFTTTQFTIPNGTGASGAAGAVVVHVWRNVDSVTPLDVTRTTATGTNSVLCNPPAITPVSIGAIIVAGGAGAHIAGKQTYSSSNLFGFQSRFSEETVDVTVGAGYTPWSGGAFDPAQFTFSAADSTSNSWAAVTLALRPA